MSTYRFDLTVITDGDTEEEALEEAMQLLADYRFAKEAATVTILAHGPTTFHLPPRYHRPCECTPHEIAEGHQAGCPSNSGGGF